MKIVLVGPKGSGKSTLGKKISSLANIVFVETDELIERIYKDKTGISSSCREIYKNEGEESFRSLEKEAIIEASQLDWCLISTGGGTFFHGPSRLSIVNNSIVILLKAPESLLWNRIEQGGIPPFLQGPEGPSINAERNERLYEVAEPHSDIIYEITGENQKQAHQKIYELISNTMMLRMTSSSTLGEIIRTTTFGESHGQAVGAVLDGLKPGIEISEKDIQIELDRRKPGQSKVTTQRKEDDLVHIVSGVFDGKTTGTPICMVVYNKDQDSSKYDNLKDLFRPGHADFTFWKKFGIRDHRGGGRSSARETVGRVASGAVAKKILNKQNITITAYSQEIHGITGEKVDYDYIEKNSVRAADPDKAQLMEDEILNARKNNDSVGGIVRLVISGISAGLGDPVFFKLDARLAMALFSIGAIKGVEVGAGFEAARSLGSENNDAMSKNGFDTNHSGGILGGISTGEDIILSIAVKPTPSISQNQKTITKDDSVTDVLIEGRHDPCIVPRIIPIIESMSALVILDALEIQKGINNNEIL